MCCYLCGKENGWVSIPWLNSQRLTTNRLFGYSRGFCLILRPTKRQKIDERKMNLYTFALLTKLMLICTKYSETIWESLCLISSFLSVYRSPVSSHQSLSVELLKPLIPAVQPLDYSSFTHMQRKNETAWFWRVTSGGGVATRACWVGSGLNINCVEKQESVLMVTCHGCSKHTDRQATAVMLRVCLA